MLAVSGKSKLHVDSDTQRWAFRMGCSAEAPLAAPWTDPVVMDFLEHLEIGTCKTAGFSCDSEAVQHSLEGLHHMDV